MFQEWKADAGEALPSSLQTSLSSAWGEEANEKQTDSPSRCPERQYSRRPSSGLP